MNRLDLDDLDEEDLVSIGRVATYLGLAVSTVRKYDLERKLPHHSRTITGHRRYRVGTVRDFRRGFVTG